MSAPAMRRLLSDVIEDAKSGFACGTEDPAGVFQLRMNNIRRDGTLDLSKQKRVPRAQKAVESALLHVGDVLFNATNSPDLVGKTALISRLQEPTVYSNHFIRLRTRSEVLEPAYLARWLSWQFQCGTFKGICRQWVNQATVGKESLLNLSIPLLSIEGQQRVAEVLDQADELRAKRRQAIGLLDDLAQSIFLDMFGDPSTNPKGWGTFNFGSVVQEFRYGTSNKSGDDGLPALRIPNVLGGRLDLRKLKLVSVTAVEEDRLQLKDGDLLFVRTNGNPDYVGRCAVFSEESVRQTGYASDRFIYASYLIRARLQSGRFNSEYVREFMLSATGRRTLRESSKTSAGQFNINIDGLGRVPIPSPPLKLQSEFANSLSRIEAMRAAHEAHLAELDELFGSLQGRAFRGEL